MTTSHFSNKGKLLCTETAPTDPNMTLELELNRPVSPIISCGKCYHMALLLVDEHRKRRGGYLLG
jgi:hypothetical protein